MLNVVPHLYLHFIIITLIITVTFLRPYTLSQLMTPDNSKSEEEFGRDLCTNDADDFSNCFRSSRNVAMDAAFVSQPPFINMTSRVSSHISDLVSSNFGTTFDMTMTVDQLRAQTGYLQGRHWIDGHTSSVHIGVPLYNVEYGAWMNMVYVLDVSDTGEQQGILSKLLRWASVME